MVNPVLGEIRMFAGDFAPKGWMMCDGSELQASTNSALFSLIGSMYGGDGKKTFNLPDLRGRITVGDGTGHGLSPRTLGRYGGGETVHMQPEEVPQHTHYVFAASQLADSQSPDGTSFGTVASDALFYVDTSKPTRTPRRTFSTQAIGPSGGSPRPEPHDNVMPSVCINFIISIQGAFPSS